MSIDDRQRRLGHGYSSSLLGSLLAHLGWCTLFLTFFLVGSSHAFLGAVAFHKRSAFRRQSQMTPRLYESAAGPWGEMIRGPFTNPTAGSSFDDLHHPTAAPSQVVTDHHEATFYGRLKPDLLAQLANHYSTPSEASWLLMEQQVQQYVMDLQALTKKLLFHDDDDDTGVDTQRTNLMKDWMAKQWRPHFMNAGVVEWVINKPRGYAGDYLSIDYIYNNKPMDHLTPVGYAIDRAFLQTAAAQAVRYRRAILAQELRHTIRQAPESGPPVEITCLACGPGGEVQDVVVAAEEAPCPGTAVHFRLVDHDKDALELVETWWCKQLNNNNNNTATSSSNDDTSTTSIHLYQRNPIRLLVGKEKLQVPPQDLVYSMGLIDYLEEKAVIRLLNLIYDMLRPGGRVILGNFHASNPSRGLLETVLDWQLIHRREEDMHRLFSRSKFARPCTQIITDDQGVQILAYCEKAAPFTGPGSSSSSSS